MPTYKVVLHYSDGDEREITIHATDADDARQAVEDRIAAQMADPFSGHDKGKGAPDIKSVTEK